MTVQEKNSTLSIIRPRSSTLNTKYIWAVLIKLHDSATYDDRRKSYEWLKHQALKCNLSLFKESMLSEL
jgi:hypothetical protein